jgi:hypothetical protein
VAQVDPSAARLVGSVRNVGFAARLISAGDRHRWQAVVEASLAPAGEEPAVAILDAVFAGRRPAHRPRPHTAWAGNYLHPYMLARGHRGTVVGVGIGDGARRWRLQQPLTRPRRLPAAAPLARLSGNASAILRQLVPGLPPSFRPLAAAAAARVGSLEASVTIQSDAVRASATLRRR